MPDTGRAGESAVIDPAISAAPAVAQPLEGAAGAVPDDARTVYHTHTGVQAATDEESEATTDWARKVNIQNWLAGVVGPEALENPPVPQPDAPGATPAVPMRDDITEWDAGSEASAEDAPPQR